MLKFRKWAVSFKLGRWYIAGVMLGATMFEWQIGPLYGGINRPRFFSLRRMGIILWDREYFDA